MENKDTDCTALNLELVKKTKSKMQSKAVFDVTADFFKVMSDCTRLRLLWALDENEMCVCDLAVVLNMTKSAVSHQLKTLKEAKLVKFRKVGKNVYYSLDDDHIKTVLEMALIHINEC
jgi:ArsR family transcriptional regulator